MTRKRLQFIFKIKQFIAILIKQAFKFCHAQKRLSIGTLCRWVIEHRPSWERFQPLRLFPSASRLSLRPGNANWI